MKGHRYIPKHAKKVFQGKIFSVWQWEQKLYDGSSTIFEHISRFDTVHTVGVMDDKRILLTWDSQPDREPVLTPAGGKIERGESPERAAMREFEEETGYRISKLVPWHTYYPSSKSDWAVHAFIGHQLKKIGDPHLDPGEQIELRFYSFDEFLHLGSNPDLRDKMLRIILLEAQLDPKKKKNLRNLLYG